MKEKSFLTSMRPGHVWLAGAGPGDPGLLTLQAVRGLEQADVIVYDALVSDDILSFASPEAEILYAGKRGGKPSPYQEDISNLLVEKARENLRVLRLKGGDPFVFGRGGEEALSLVYAHIPFRIIPGVSSVTAGLAYAGIPLTHRDCNSSVTLLTGHNVDGRVSDDINWKAMATAMPVIVMVMALKHMPEISARLLQHGRDPHDKIAFISDATLPSQKVTITDLAHAGVVSLDQKAPCLVVIGSVVNLHTALSWFQPATSPDDKIPLKTKTSR